MNRPWLALMTIAGLVFAPLLVHAQEPAYPVRPIRLIVPSTPGSPPDLVGRVLGERLALALGQPVVVDNRPGASGTIGLNAVAKAAPDGYTLGMLAMPAVVIPSLRAEMPYDTEKDLAAVAMVEWNYNLLAVPAGSPFGSVADLVAAARAKPGAVRFSSGGNGTPSHLAAELLKREAGVDMTHVPYKGIAPAVVAVVSGEVDVTFGSVGTLSPHVKSGKLRTLASTAPQRTQAYPEVPTFVELGYPGVQIRGWNGIVTTAGTPANVVDRLYAEIVKVTAMPEFKLRFEALGLEPAGLGPKEFASHIRAEMQRWGKLVRDLGIKAD